MDTLPTLCLNVSIILFNSHIDTMELLILTFLLEIKSQFLHLFIHAVYIAYIKI